LLRAIVPKNNRLLASTTTSVKRPIQSKHKTRSMN